MGYTLGMAENCLCLWLFSNTWKSLKVNLVYKEYNKKNISLYLAII